MGTRTEAASDAGSEEVGGEGDVHSISAYVPSSAWYLTRIRVAKLALYLPPSTSPTFYFSHLLLLQPISKTPPPLVQQRLTSLAVPSNLLLGHLPMFPRRLPMGFHNRGRCLRSRWRFRRCLILNQRHDHSYGLDVCLDSDTHDMGSADDDAEEGDGGFCAVVGDIVCFFPFQLTKTSRLWLFEIREIGC